MKAFNIIRLFIALAVSGTVLGLPYFTSLDEAGALTALSQRSRFGKRK